MQQILSLFAGFPVNGSNTTCRYTTPCRSFLSARQRTLRSPQSFLRLPQALGCGNFVKDGSVIGSNERRNTEIDADGNITRRHRRGLLALELPRDHPAIAVAPDACRQQSTRRKSAAAKPYYTQFWNAHGSVSELRRLPDTIDAGLVDEFLFWSREATAATGFLLRNHAPKCFVQTRHSVENGVRGQISQPYRLGLALHRDGNRLQLFPPQEFSGRFVFRLFALQQPVPQKAQGAGPLIQAPRLVSGWIESRLPATHDHATSSFQRSREAPVANTCASRSLMPSLRRFQRTHSSCR